MIGKFLRIISLFCLIFNLTSGEFERDCGCKTFRPCYKKMINTLKDRDETICVENAVIGSSTVVVYLKALDQFCGDVVDIKSEHTTFDGRNLYEVVLHSSKLEAPSEDRPLIMIDAGQDAGTHQVGFALFVIEQLVACEEDDDMIEKATWVILPNTNPDGQEYRRFQRRQWRKNTKKSEDQMSFGVDITRNFNTQWGTCEKVDNGFSDYYPGPEAGSENETQFIKSVMNKHKTKAKLYLSLRRDGHSILYPFSSSNNKVQNLETHIKAAAEFTEKVNQRAGSVQIFRNLSIFDANSDPHCGHSVDYAIEIGIPLAFEIRAFLDSENQIIRKFHPLPKGYQNTLRTGYFTGIRELFNMVVNEKKYGIVITP